MEEQDGPPRLGLARRGTQWSTVAQFELTPPPDVGNADFVGRLYEETAGLFGDIVKFQQKEAHPAEVDRLRSLYRLLKDTYHRFLSWGRDHRVKDGDLDNILEACQSDRQLTMRYMLKVSVTLREIVLPLVIPELKRPHPGARTSVSDFPSQAETIWAKATLLKNTEEEVAARAPHECDTAGGDWDESPPPEHICCHNERPTLETAIRYLQDDVGLLEDLSRLLEEPLPDTPESDIEESREPLPDDVSSRDANIDIFWNRVKAKFPMCNEGLVDVIALANYAAFMRLQKSRESAQREREEAVRLEQERRAQQDDATETPMVSITMADPDMLHVASQRIHEACGIQSKLGGDSAIDVRTVATTRLACDANLEAEEPRQFLSPTPVKKQKLVDDSALGSSSYHDSTDVPGRTGINLEEGNIEGDQSVYAGSTLSITRDSVKRTRFPPQPHDVPVGSLFPCIACGQDVFKSSSNGAWKRHLIFDLRPWVCCQVSCACIQDPTSRVVFESRREWEEHHKALLKVHPNWDHTTCPFCQEAEARGPAEMIRHVEWHLHDAFLASLPPEQDDEDDVDEDDDSATSDEDGAGNRRAKPPLSRDGDKKWFQRHPVYLAAKAEQRSSSSGLWYCPWGPEDYCDHSKPTILQAEFDQWVEGHLETLRCKFDGCAHSDDPFATIEILRRHEQKVHDMHPKSEGRFLCPSDGCGRSREGNGFASLWVLEQHVNDIHENMPELLNCLGQNWMSN